MVEQLIYNQQVRGSSPCKGTKKQKNKKKKIKKGLKIINQIQKIRSKNNKNWMDLLKLSLKLDFKSTSRILKEIVKDDRKISNLAQKISDLK